jgi:hypothetical protein
VNREQAHFVPYTVCHGDGGGCSRVARSHGTAMLLVVCPVS